jgi:cysteine desulfuration protein SufE
MSGRETLAEACTAIEREFAALGDWDAQFQHLVALGRGLPDPDPDLLTDANRVQGCQSQVWMDATRDPDTGVVRLRAHSDAVIVRGLIAVLLRLYSGRTAREILEQPADALERIGLADYLAPGRANGLNLMIRRIGELAAEDAAEGRKRWA